MLNYRRYRLLTSLASPFIPLWLYFRARRGKEDRARLRERFGYGSKPRPAGTLLWLHAASVGEANSVLLFIGRIRERFPPIRLLLTTGTVTSAQLMQARLPAGVIHHYAPVDTPAATRRFIRHWAPDIAFWVESELWPNLIEAADDYRCFLGIINARMSERSFRSWQKHPALIKDMLSRFNVIFAQSGGDAGRLQALGAGANLLCLGNLKYDAALLPCDEGELITLKNAIGERPVWLAASTHAGEEAVVTEAHRQLAKLRPDLLTVIVPRHPARGGEIRNSISLPGVAQRSKAEPITPATSLYIADTLGELGLFYRLCEIVFMGGSLVRRGGQNPLEAGRLSCAILTGPHILNFADIYQEMERAQACLRVRDAAELGSQVERLLTNRPALDALQEAGRVWVESQGGACERILDMLTPVLEPQKEAQP